MIVHASDQGMPFIYRYGNTEAAKAFAGAVTPLLNLDNNRKDDKSMKKKSAETGKETLKAVKMAVPIEHGRLCNHFGHCETLPSWMWIWTRKSLSGGRTSRRLPMNPACFRLGSRKEA